MNKYDDIINLSRPKSTHPKMSLLDRAAQFAPFAALTTHGDAIKEVGRITNKQIDLSEEEINDINFKLQTIKANIKNKPNITVTYFVKDENKDGGKYVTINNNIKKIDYNNLIFIDNCKVKIADIIFINVN